MEKIFDVAILGVGSRGGDIYSKLIDNKKDKFKIVALCDKRQERLDRFGNQLGVKEENRFLNEDEFFAEKRADILIIATQDKDHYRHILRAFETGYDVLVEKPLTGDRNECFELLEAQKKYGKKALVCHVLRYAPAFVKVGDMIKEGSIGRLVMIDALERVAYWHQAHSYVRGNWRNNSLAMPMILAKCCHDLDLLQYYADSKSVTVSSVGDLTFFNKDNAPKDSGDRCTKCKYMDTCPYSAKRLYVDKWHTVDCPENRWPYNIICNAPVTEEKLYDAINTGDYGRCVFKCDNDVVDHQITTITFENGVKATLTMTGFTYNGGRRIVFHGTMGELILDEESGEITLARYGEEKQIIKIADLCESGYGHGGGDNGLINTLYDMMTDKADNRTSLEASIESHLMGICAEESRLSGGTLIYVHKK